jgi:hypothetical protein
MSGFWLIKKSLTYFRLIVNIFNKGVCLAMLGIIPWPKLCMRVCCEIQEKCGKIRERCWFEMGIWWGPYGLPPQT